MFNKIAVIGLGLLGASISRSVKMKKLAKTVLGVDRSPNVLKEALEKKFIDEGALCFDENLKDCDFILLCMPVGAIVESFEKIARFVSPNAFISDVGSVKKDIVQAASFHFKNFIGSHPLVGSEKSGLFFSKDNFFSRSLCLITENDQCDSSKWEQLCLFWKNVGCRLLVLSSEQHDLFMSRTSHLPHVLSSALVLSMDYENFPFVSKGFEDMSRLALGSPEIWTDILLSNAENVSGALLRFEKEMMTLRSALKNKSYESVYNWLNHALGKKKDALQ